MNRALEQFARNEIRKGFQQLPRINQIVILEEFAGDGIDRDLDQFVNDIPKDKLTSTMKQIEAIIKRRSTLS